MTLAAQDRGGTARRPAAPDVLACMPDGPLASAVARVAVREAVRRGARVRFLRVIRAGMDDRERAAADDRTFSVALRALREAPRARVAFETVEGDVASVVLNRSTRAGVLVVGAERAVDEADRRCTEVAGSRTGQPGIAELCRGRAGCPVLVVQAASGAGAAPPIMAR